MSQQLINLGSVANDGTGSPLRTGGSDINANFTELYAGMFPVFNVKALAYGAVGDGSTDDTAAIQAAITAASAAVVVDTIPGHVTGAAIVYFPDGLYKTSAPLTLGASGIYLVGSTSGGATIIPSAGTDGLDIAGGSAYLRHIGIVNLSIDYTTVSAQNGAIGINISKTSDTNTMRDVQVIFAPTNTATSLKGVSWTDSESWAVTNVFVAYGRSTGSIGFYFDNNGINRGNMVFTNCQARDWYIGWKNVGSNVTNGLVFNAFKVVNSTSGAAVVPLYGIWVAGQTYGISFVGLHIEATAGGSLDFTTGVFLDATGTAIRDVTILDPVLTRCTTGIDFGSGGGTVQHVRVYGVRFLSTETITTGFVLGSGAKDSWIIGATRQPTVTTWITDNSTAGSGNFYLWNVGGGVDAQPWTYKGRQGSLAVCWGAAAPSAGTAFTPDLSLGNDFLFTANASPTINAAINPPTNVTGLTPAQPYCVTILNATGGAIATSWNAAFHLAGSWTDPAAGKRRSVWFRYDVGSSVSYEISRSAADVS